MQLTAIVALLAASASAAPGTLSPRASGSVRARFYNDNGCDGNGAGVPRAEVVLQTSATPGKAGCRDLTVGSFPAAFYDQSTLDQQSRIRVLNVPCSRVTEILDRTPGSWIDLGPGNVGLGCQTLNARSYLTLP